MSGRLSIIVPVLDEAAGIEAALVALSPCRARGVEVIVVDGGSRDGSAGLADPLASRVLIAPRGRATQMNAGAAMAQGDILLFLHADTQLPDNADLLIQRELARSGRAWGRFDIRFDRGGSLKIIALMMNLRSRLTGNCDRRSGRVCHPRRVRCRRRLPLDPADGGRCAIGTDKTHQPPALHSRPCHHLRPSLAKTWGPTHNFSDVAAATGILLRHRPCATRTPLRLCLRRQ